MANEQISLPSLVLIVVLSGLVVRYLFFSSPPQVQPPRDAQSASRQREAAVERIQQMFPQVDRRTILWDLQRNGANMAATTERILAGRMETPPVTFQPPPPPSSPTPSSSQSQTQSKAPQKPTEPDLIKRYKLQDKITSASETEAAADSKSKGWSTNREERQTALQRRRDEMILAARRKMEAKIAAEQTAAGS